MNTIAPAAKTVAATALLPLARSQDPCDRCSALALVRVALGDLILDFCNHHFRKHEAALAAAGGTVIDSKVGIA